MKPADKQKTMKTIQILPAALALPTALRSIQTIKPNSAKMKTNPIHFSVLLLTLVASAAIPIHAETFKLVATQNAQLDASAPDTAFEDWGILDVFSFSGPTSLRRALLQFDLSAIPAGASVSSLKLGLFPRYSGDSTADQELWRVENDGWNQSTVTWNSYTAGTSSLVGTRGLFYGGGYNEWPLDLNAWNAATDLADGKLTLLVKFPAAVEGDGFYRGMQYYSRQVPNPNNLTDQPDTDIVPYLEVTYTGGAPVSPLLLQIENRPTNTVALAWNTFPGRKYQVQAKTALDAANWVNQGALTIASQAAQTNELATSGEPAQFFRVVLLP